MSSSYGTARSSVDRAPGSSCATRYRSPLETVTKGGPVLTLARTVHHRPPLLSIMQCGRGIAMIRSFHDRDTERLATRQRVTKWSPELSRAELRWLRILDAAEELTDLRVPPGNRHEQLKGDPLAQHSIRVNNQQRICLRLEAGTADDVEIIDEHEEEGG